MCARDHGNTQRLGTFLPCLVLSIWVWTFPSFEMWQSMGLGTFDHCKNWCKTGLRKFLEGPIWYDKVDWRILIILDPPVAAPLPGLCSMKTQCDWPPLALGSAGGRGLAQPPPAVAAWESKSYRGCKVPSGGFVHRHEIWTQASFESVPAYLRARKVNWRSALTLPPQTWRHSSAGRAAAAVSLYSLSALFLPILFYFSTGCVQIARREPCGVYLCWAPGLAQWEWGEMWAQSTQSEGNEKPKEFTSETVDGWGQGYPKMESF